MKKSQIINYLKLINDELTDAYHLTDSMNNPDALVSIECAQELVGELQDNINGKFDHRPLTSEEATEGLMGPDRLPLNFPYHINDGEGRLKGNN